MLSTASLIAAIIKGEATRFRGNSAATLAFCGLVFELCGRFALPLAKGCHQIFLASVALCALTLAVYAMSAGPSPLRE